MQLSDLFVSDPVASGEVDPWAPTPQPTQSMDLDLVQALRRGPVAGHSDIEAALVLVQLAHEELEAFGTSGGEKLDDPQFSTVLIALRAVLRRLAIDFDPPYRNFTTFRTHWIREGASGSWQARRDMLTDVFEPLYQRLLRLEERTFEALADPISPRAETGWPVVDEEIRELRRRFQTSSTPQDYSSVGTLCVRVLDALSRTVFDPDKHLRDGEQPPAPDKSKQRIGRYVEDALPGPANADVRALATRAIELAHHVKHTPTPTRREAGIAADAVILLANILRRLEQEF